MEAKDVQTVRTALEYFIARADGCPNKECSVCRRHAETAKEAFAALDRIAADECPPTPRTDVR